MVEGDLQRAEERAECGENKIVDLEEAGHGGGRPAESGGEGRVRGEQDRGPRGSWPWWRATCRERRRGPSAGRTRSWTSRKLAMVEGDLQRAEERAECGENKIVD